MLDGINWLDFNMCIFNGATPIRVVCVCMRLSNLFHNSYYFGIGVENANRPRKTERKRENCTYYFWDFAIAQRRHIWYALLGSFCLDFIPYSAHNIYFILKTVFTTHHYTVTLKPKMQLTRRYDEHARVQTNENRNEMKWNEMKLRKSWNTPAASMKWFSFPFMSYIVI